MTILKQIPILLTLLILGSCGSGERVITDDGKVYEVNGNTIEKNGVEVTENLSSSEKTSIDAFIDKKEKIRQAFEDQQKALESAIEKQEAIQDKAEAKQNDLENQLETLEENFEAKQDAKDNYASVKKRYDDKKLKFKKLKKEGELSPNDIKDWKEKLSKLSEKVKAAKKELDKS